jgi:hypothetical protein
MAFSRKFKHARFFFSLLQEGEQAGNKQPDATRK